MMDHECEACGAQFFIPGQMGDSVVGRGRCPDCGSSVFRSQPTPLHSDMEMRNMPEPGEEDMGGNPLQEGVLADNGWKGRQNRDESFASVQSSARSTFDWAQGQYSTIFDSQGPEAAEQWLQGIPLSEDIREAVRVGDPTGLSELPPDPPDSQMNPFGEGGATRGKGEPYDALDALAEGDNRNYQEGIDEWNQGLLDKSEGRELGEEWKAPPTEQSTGHSLAWEPGQEGRGLFIGDHLHTWPVHKTAENPQGGLMHSEYARAHGGTPQDAATGFEIDSEGNPILLGNRDPDMLQRITQADNRIKEQNAFTFGHISMTPYSSWMHQSDADFETESVIPPGPHSIEVENGGSGVPPDLHYGSMSNLAMMGVHVNGEPIDDMNALIRHQGPLVLSHDDPQALDLAKHIKEVGSPFGREDEYTNYTHPHEANVELPPIPVEQARQHPASQALGAFNFMVKDPTTNQYAPYAQAYQSILGPGGPLSVRHADPEAIAGLQELLASGNMEPLKAYQQRMAKTAFLGPVGDAFNAVKDEGQNLGVIPKNLSPGQILFHNPISGGITAPMNMGVKAIDQATGLNIPSPQDAMESVGEATGMVPQDWSPKELGVAAATDAATLLGGAGVAKIAPTVASKLAPLAAKVGIGSGAGAEAGGLMSKVAPWAGRYLQMKGAEGLIGNNPATQALQQVGQPPQPSPSMGLTTAPSVGLVTPQATPVNPMMGSVSAIEILADADWHPSSDPVMHDDPKDRKDGDTSNPLYDPTVNGIGGTDEGPDGWMGHGDDPEIAKHGGKLVAYALSPVPSSNDDDPEFVQFVDKLAQSADPNDQTDLEPFFQHITEHLQNVHDDMHKSGVLGGGHSPEILSAMNPGHVPMPPQAPAAPLAPDPVSGTHKCPRCGVDNSPEATTCVGCGSGMGASQGVNLHNTFSAVGDALNTFQYDTPQQKVPQPIPQSDFSTAKCPHCGAGMPPGSLVCPQCNQSAMAATPTPQAQPNVVNQSVPLTSAMKESAGHQGPHNNEQFAAVAQLLTDEGREDEIPNMLQNPWDYADELARAQNKQTMPPIDETQTAAPPQPAQEEAPPEATMPMPGMSAGPPMTSHVDNRLMSALEHYADATGGPDSFAPRCPKCHGGSTGTTGEDGDILCHTCGHHWKKEIIKDVTSSFMYISDNARPNPQGVPAADQHHQHDLRHEQDSSMTWQDLNGDPLHTGEQYEMQIPGVSIPDIITVEDVKPDSLNYTLTGEYGISHKTELTNEEKELENITFSPLDNFQTGDGGPDDLDQNMDSKQVPGPGEQTDLSTPHVMMTHRQAAQPHDDGYGPPIPKDLCPECGTELYGRHGAGQAGACPVCGYGRSEDPQYHPDYNTQDPQNPYRDDSLYSKVAGKHYTMPQQREFVDEQGTARNLDKLALEGTHYLEDDDDLLGDSILFL